MGRQQMDDSLGRHVGGECTRLQVDDPVFVGPWCNWRFARLPLPDGSAKLSYFLISVGATGYLGHVSPDRALGAVSSDRFYAGTYCDVFFGWLPLYLPELFPVKSEPRARASQ